MERVPEPNSVDVNQEELSEHVEDLENTPEAQVSQGSGSQIVEELDEDVLLAEDPEGYVMEAQVRRARSKNMIGLIVKQIQKYSTASSKHLSVILEPVVKEMRVLEEVVEAREAVVLSLRDNINTSNNNRIMLLQMGEREAVLEEKVKKLEEELKALKEQQPESVEGQDVIQVENRAVKQAKAKGDNLRWLQSDKVRELELKTAMLTEKLAKSEAEVRHLSTLGVANSFSRRDWGRQCDVNELKKGIPDRTDGLLFVCKCPTPCTFRLSGRDSVSTTSPTLLIRMAVYLEKSTKYSDGDLRVLSQKSLPVSVEGPPPHVWTELARCPSMSLWIRDLPFRTHFESLYSKILGHSIGKVMIEKEALVVLAPDVKFSSVPLTPKPLQLVEAHWRDQLQKAISKVTKQVILVLPVENYATRLDMWTAIVKEVPEDIRLLLVSAPNPKDPCTAAQDFASAMQTLQRPGTVWRVLPTDSLASLHRGRMLIDVGSGQPAATYWNYALEIVKSNGWEWPNFELFSKSSTGSSMNWAEEMQKETGDKKEVKRTAAKREGQANGAENKKKGRCGSLGRIDARAQRRSQ